jgi:FAD/FMN-containing dehydrogenase/Fe-S oxidoreductase
MIAALSSGGDESAYHAFLAALRAEGFAGDIDTAAGTRTVYATDNSIYQLAPTAVVFPRSRADLVLIAQLVTRPAFRKIKVTMRGGGTGTNGQSLTDGLVVDMSRHMNRIVSIDPMKRTAIVEAGVVKDQLNRALEPHGLFFAPELSTSNRATIGGMINTDASGQGSCLYGKTSNHVVGLRVVVLGGTEWLSHPLAPAALSETKRRDDRIGNIYRTADKIARDHAALIDRVFPKLNRFLTGYDLAHLRTADGGLNLNAVLCGAEGTLALIAEAELNLLPIPRCHALINIRYDNFSSALTDARTLAALGVASVETLDGKVLSLARGDMIWSRIATFFPADVDGLAEGINIVEVLANHPEELEGRIAQVEATLAGSHIAGRRGHTITAHADEIEAIWTMRKRAVGLLGNATGPRRPLPFVEDTAVPPEHLADYIAEFRALLDAEGLAYGMFGHVDAGVLHVRPALDLSDPEQALLVRRISDAVFALTRKYRGVLWGEHGKGVRSEYVPETFGALYPALQQLKAAFDPYNQLNPGKIATPPGSDELARIDAFPLRGTVDRQINSETREAFDNAAYCNGNGACFDFDVDSAMCPSFKGTGDRRFSPKGRASLLREWLLRQAREGIDPRAEVEFIRRRPAWRGLPRRVLNSLLGKRGDFSHEVRAAMDNCLACKACASQCPVKVDVPAFRSKFLEHYYSRYLRPLKDPLVASIEHLLPVVGRAAGFYNLLVGSKAGKVLLAFTGLTALPALSRICLSEELRQRGVAYAQAGVLNKLSKEEKARSVVLVQDAFTSYFETQLLLDVVDLLTRLGFTPLVAPLWPNGKAQHVHGYLRAFARTAGKTARELTILSQSGVPLVGLDPSMTLCYREEYLATLGPERAPTVLLLQEWLVDQLDRLGDLRLRSAHRYVLFAHCTEQTRAAASVESWLAIFQRLGLDAAIVNVGCCGMAGTFGHEIRNRRLSDRIYELSWQRKLEALGSDNVPMVTGYSCRSQVAHMGFQGPIAHPMQVLARLVMGRSV